MTPLNLQDLLGDPKAEEMKRNLDAAAQIGNSTFIGIWSRATGFAVVAELDAGRPFRWHVCGPIQIADARVWLGSVESKLTNPVLQ